MPLKICPVCGATWGARKLVCDHCSWDFGCKRPGKASRPPTRSPVWPEPGEGVWEKPKGFPATDPPGPLPDGLLGIEEIQHQVRYEGLGFCINFIDPNRIEDSTLRAFWVMARRASRNVISYLEEKGNE